jgi:hypothetical protein
MPDSRAMRLTSGYQHHSRPPPPAAFGKILPPSATSFWRTRANCCAGPAGHPPGRWTATRAPTSTSSRRGSKRRSSSGSSSCPSRSTRNGWSSRMKGPKRSAPASSSHRRSITGRYREQIWAILTGCGMQPQTSRRWPMRRQPGECGNEPPPTDGRSLGSGVGRPPDRLNEVPFPDDRPTGDVRRGD